MRTLLIVFCLTAFIATTFAQSCDSDTNAIANKLSGFAQRLTSCNTADLNTICDSSSDCRKAIRDLFAYAENCATQISGSGVNFAVLVDQWNQAITAACNSRPEDLLALYFGNCPNVNNLVNAAKKVLNDCTAAATCSDACRSSLNSYYKEIYACVSPNNEDANQDGIRHVFESLCQLVSAEQSCVQTLFANLHLVNDKCSGDGTFTCSSECSAAITSAFNTAAANCPLDAADILGQYDSACNADCGPNVDSAYTSISEACSPLSAVTPSQDDCTACVNAIADARTTSACLSLSTTSSDEVLSLLSDLATQACTVDVAAKDLANSDVFGSKARNAAASCRSGICDSECQSALNSLVSSVKDAYSPLSPPDSVRDDLNALKDLCSQPAPGFSHRIDVVLSDINCNVILSYAQDYIYRFAQIFGLSPADLVIVDCSESSTRATDTTLTMGSANTPKKASTSSCDDVSLSCSKITTSSSTGSGSGSGSSPASTLFLSSFLVAISMIALWFF